MREKEKRQARSSLLFFLFFLTEPNLVRIMKIRIEPNLVHQEGEKMYKFYLQVDGFTPIPDPVFESYILEEMFRKSDKTWRRLRRWSLDHYFSWCDKDVFESTSLNDYEYLDYVVIKDLEEKKRYLDEMNPGWERYDSYQLHLEYNWSDVEVYFLKGKAMYLHFISAYAIRPFKILNDKEEVIFESGQTDPYELHNDKFMSDWELIHKLSGQDKRRELRIQISNNLGSLGGEFFRTPPVAGPYVPNKERIPRRVGCFRRTDRGNYMTWIGGKIYFSPTNRTGYYRIVKEKERCGFLELVEEVRFDSMKPL